MSEQVSEHLLNKYGTTDCPVERVRAFADDGECSACGGEVLPTTDTTEET